MLKITKGLKPTVSEGIMTYTDDRGNVYVRVKLDDEDFCIMAHDCLGYHKSNFNWDEAMHMMEQGGLTMLTLKQAGIYKEHLTEVNNKLKEIGGEALTSDWYWTSSTYDDESECSCIYWGSNGATNRGFRFDSFKVRPVLNLQ